MGTVFKKTFTKPLPEGAELFIRDGERRARWKPAKGRTRTASVTISADGELRILVKVGTYIAKFRDGRGLVVEKSTGCREEGAARSVLAELERRAERVRSGILTENEDRVADHLLRPIAEHYEAYFRHLQAKRSSATHLRDVKRQLATVAEDCGIRRLSDLDREEMSTWLDAKIGSGASARTANGYRVAWLGFCNWAVKNDRLVTNPFADIDAYDQVSDRRTERRAFTDEELSRLLDAARQRLLLDASKIRRGSRAGEFGAKLKKRTRARLELEGDGRALLYLVAVTTGLRRSELSRLILADAELDAERKVLRLAAVHEKSRRGAEIPLRDDVAQQLAQILERRLSALRSESEARCEPIPVALPPDTALFHLPTHRTFDNDRKFAKIAKKDARGRVIDFHALRVTFGTNLARSGASMRVAQSALRHTDPKLTANVYTDPALLDVEGAIERLPMPNLLKDPDVESKKAVGESGALAPGLAPTPVDSGASESFPDHLVRDSHSRMGQAAGAEFAPETHETSPAEASQPGLCFGSGGQT